MNRAFLRTASAPAWNLSRPASRVTVLTRRFAHSTTVATPPPPKSTPKPKPNKSPVSLKRTASASLPIRSNPTPTRGAIQPVYTYATAERYDLKRIRLSLPDSAVRFEEAWWTSLSAEGDPFSSSSPAGEAWIFRNGTIVCWGLEEDASRRFVEKLCRDAKTAQIAPLKQMETEELEFVIDPAETTRLQGDLIILGTSPPISEMESLPTLPQSTALPLDTFASRYSFSQALGRSTALSAFETSLDTYISSVERLPQALIDRGEPGLSRKVLIQQLGHLLRFRQGLNLGPENFGDMPDFYWQEPALETYFVAMSSALEISQRITALNRKITYASEVQVTLRELLTESSGHRMELIIIYLIAVEVVIAIIRDGPELWDMLAGSEEKPKKALSHD